MAGGGGGGGGGGWGRGIFEPQEFFSLSNSLYEFFFRPLHEYFLGLIGVQEFFLIKFSLARIFFFVLRPPPPPPHISFLMVRPLEVVIKRKSISSDVPRFKSMVWNISSSPLTASKRKIQNIEMANVEFSLELAERHGYDSWVGPIPGS